MPRGNPKNLIKNSELTPEQLKKMTSNGGKKSVQVRKEKKLMSAILADYLARQNGYDSFDKYIENVLKRGDSATVSMIKTFVESIEGSKVKMETVLTVNTDDEAVAEVLKKYGVSKSKT